MLSQSAERVYWLGRYIERTEDTARMLKAFSQVMMDIPKSKKLGWEILLRILYAEYEFYKLYDDASENNVINFLLIDKRNPSSIFSSVKAARENARTSRDVIPLEAWEMLSDLNLLLKSSTEKTTLKKNRYQFLSEIIAKTQEFNGVIQNSSTRDQAYSFLQIGSLLERADMTSRMLDVAAGILLQRDSSEDGSFDMLIWLEILKAQNCIQTYRSLNGPKIRPRKVLDLILCKEDFPRSIIFCLAEIQGFVKQLPDNDEPSAGWHLLLKQVNSFDKNKELSPEFLHKYFDDIQKSLIKMHEQVSYTWFPRFEEIEQDNHSLEELSQLQAQS